MAEHRGMYQRADKSAGKGPICTNELITNQLVNKYISSRINAPMHLEWLINLTQNLQH